MEEEWKAKDICGATNHLDHGSHRGGFETVVCLENKDHEGLHHDGKSNYWGDVKAIPARRREHEPRRCGSCQQAPKLSYVCEIYRGFSCNQLVAAYNAGRADMAAEVGRTWPEEEEMELEPEDVVLKVAELLQLEDSTNDQDYD